MIQLRAANLKDLEILKHWDEQPHVIASGADDDWNWEYELNRTPSWREQLVAELNGRPIGFIQIIDPQEEETHYWGNVGAHKRAIDIWIGKKEDLGMGYGTIMMQLAIERCFEDKTVTEILIDPLESNQKAIRFYRRLGFVFLEKRKFDVDDCEVLLLKRQVWQNFKNNKNT